MASENSLPSTARRLWQRFQQDPRTVEDRGPADTEAEPADESGFSLAGATDWLNSPPLTGAGLRGQVVLVNFWTYTCINWLRTLPYVRAWEDSYRTDGLVVVGVHSPEFSFEHDLDNVRRAVRGLGVSYPVAVDNHFAVWRSFDNHYWPAVYLVDAGGRLRHTNFGEGGYEETEKVLRQLLTEAGSVDLRARTVPVEARGIEVPADWDTLRSAETYLGYGRTSGFASPGGLLADQPHLYAEPPRLRRGQWAVSGTWTAGREATTLQEAGGRLSCRFHSRDLHLVAAPGPGGQGPAVRFRVLLDGQEPGGDHGIDTDAAGHGVITEPGLHQLLRRGGHVAESTAEIEFLDPGVGLYCFTFG